MAQASKMSSVVTGLESQLEGLSAEQEAAGHEDAEQLAQADAIAKANAAEEKATLQEVASAEDHLREQSSDLSREIDGKGNKLMDQLGLAALSVNPDVEPALATPSPF